MNILLTVKIRKVNWIGDILGKKCLLKHVSEEMMQGRGRRWRRSKRLLDDIKETRKYRKLEGQAPRMTLWKTSFGRGSEPVVRQTTWWCWWFWSRK